MTVARRWLATSLCTTALVAAAGCGSSASHVASSATAAGGRPAVQLSLTAPTDGANVSVDRLKVFGTVTPEGAAVSIGGHRAGRGDGTFERWIALRRGANHIHLRATAPGYAPAALDVTVTAGAASALSGAPAPRPNGFVAEADAVCSDVNNAVMSLPPMVDTSTLESDLQRLIVLNDSAVSRLRKIAPPPAKAARYAEWLSLLSSQDGRARQILHDIQHSAQGGAAQRIAHLQKLVGAAGWLRVSAGQSDAIARQLGLTACAADVSPGA
jgi:hypothetical protein